MKTHHFVQTALVAALALAGCSTIPEKNARLDEARSDYNVAQNNPQVTTLAGSELKQASDALNKANDAWSKNENAAQVDQLAYLAKQRVAIAQEAARLKTAEATTANASADRSEARLTARTKEADAAQRQAELQRWRAQNAEAQLRELQAKKTDRGLMITLGDVLFDTDKAQIKSGGMHNVQKLADVLKQYPERNVLIEGFTDNTGGDSHNQQLSDRRANAVRTSLLNMGISNDRVTSRGYGKNFPVAGNVTSAGRQLNRRVEVTISNDNGQVPPR